MAGLAGIKVRSSLDLDLRFWFLLSALPTKNADKTQLRREAAAFCIALLCFSELRFDLLAIKASHLREAMSIAPSNCTVSAKDLVLVACSWRYC